MKPLRKKKASPSAGPSGWRRGWSWYESKAPLLQFSLKFCALLLVFYALLLAPLGRKMLDLSLVGNARVANAALHWLGEQTQVTDTTVWSSKYAVTVEPACSALDLLFFFCAMVLAFPAPLSRKIPGLLAGLLFLPLLNQFRIMSLFQLGAHYPQLFATVHENFWGPALMIAEITLCAAWIGWARQGNPDPSHASA